MKLKELKEIISSVGNPIDRIAGFCDDYEQMFDTCTVEVRGMTIQIETPDDECGGASAVSEAMALLLNLPQDHDDYDIEFMGLDHQEENVALVRDVISVKTYASQKGTVGLSLQGREPLMYRDADLLHTTIVIEDEKALRLNDTFFNFVYDILGVGVDEDFESIEEEFDVWKDENSLFISFVARELVSSGLVGLLAGNFSNVYFCQTPLNTDGQVERITNDCAGKYWKKHQAVFYPANERDYRYIDEEYCVIAGSECCVVECDSPDEMEQFIAAHKLDASVGDFVQRISSSYIDSPVDFIFDKPEKADGIS